jgi:hypothetical protein
MHSTDLFLNSYSINAIIHESDSSSSFQLHRPAHLRREILTQNSRCGGYAVSSIFRISAKMNSYELFFPIDRISTNTIRAALLGALVEDALRSLRFLLGAVATRVRGQSKSCVVSA